MHAPCQPQPGPGCTEKAPVYSQGPGPPSLILTPNSFPGTGPMKHSFGTIFPGHQSHGTPRGQCRPVLEAQGNSRIGQGVRPLRLGTQACLALSPPPRLSLSLNFNMSRTSRVWHPASSLLPHSSVLGMGWALPEGIRGSSLTQDLEGDFEAVLRPVPGMLPGSGTPGGRTLIRWTEMSKVSSSLLAGVGRQKDKMPGSDLRSWKER